MSTGPSMGSMTIEQSGAPKATHSESDWRPRRHRRCRMFKAAYVILGDAAHDCVLLDVSTGGAQVYLVARVELPDLVTLLLPGGESRAMRRCWQRGSHIGFEALGDAVSAS